MARPPGESRLPLIWAIARNARPNSRASMRCSPRSTLSPCLNPEKTTASEYGNRFRRACRSAARIGGTFFSANQKRFRGSRRAGGLPLGRLPRSCSRGFIAGRLTRPIGPSTPVAVDASKVRERILVMAVGEHLGRSEMVLVELANNGPENAGQKHVNISGEQRRAEDLLEENRLYRQTALEQGDSGLAEVLDELERVLLDVAHSPQLVTPVQLEGIRQRIEARGILFKVRVVGKELQQRSESGNAPATPSGSAKSERNKV